MTELSARRRILMTSVNYGGEIYPWHYYLTACTNQARIALLHLDRLWRMEGSPPDVDVWSQRVPGGDIEVWAELQGFVTAAVILNRMLAPKPYPLKDDPDAAELKRHARRRAQKLRTLLNIDNDSPLLAIAGVRNGMEHVDERIDKIVVDQDVWSVSDWYISNEVYQESTTRHEAASEGAVGRHVNMRVFAPLPGILIFDEHSIDLFRFEIALHELLAGMVEAHEQVITDAPTGRLGFGISKPRQWPSTWTARRDGIERFRVDIRADGRSSRAINAPGSVLFVVGPNHSDEE